MSGVGLHEKLTPLLEGSLTLLESEALLVSLPIRQQFEVWAHLPDTLANSLSLPLGIDHVTSNHSTKSQRGLIVQEENTSD